jgi:hypothetical protein
VRARHWAILLNGDPSRHERRFMFTSQPEALSFVRNANEVLRSRRLIVSDPADFSGYPIDPS